MVGSVRSDYGMGIGKVVVDKDTNTAKISQKVAGLDIDEYISAVKEARKTQEKPYQDKIDKNTKTLAALSTFQTKLIAVQDLAKTMANRVSSTQPRVTNNAFQQHGVTATTSTGQNYTEIVNISASESALLGSFSMTVEQLATSDMKKGTIQTTGMNQKLNKTGTFSIGTTAGTAKTIDITDTMSLADIQNAINAVSADTKVSADVSLASIGTISTFELKLKAQVSGEPIVLQTTSGTPLTDLGFSQTTSNKICGILEAADEATALKLGGSLTIGTQNGASQSISIDQTMTLKDVVAAINDQTGTTGVKASYDLAYYSIPSKYQIKLEATNGNTVTISDTNEIAKTLGLNSPAADFNDLCANITVDGTSYKKRSNTISDIITGVTLNLKSASSTTTVQGAVIEDKDQFAKTFIELMTAYNDLNSFYSDQTKSKTSADGKNVSAAEGADLYGNIYARNTMSAIKSALTGETAGVSLTTKESSSTTALNIMGIKLQPDGSLRFENDTDFSTAISNSYSDIKKLLTNTVTVSNSDFKVVDLPTKLPANVAGKPITVNVSKDTAGKATATFTLDSVVYPATVTTTGGMITITASKDSDGKTNLLHGLTVRFDGTLNDNASSSAEIKVTQGRMAQVDNECSLRLDENLDSKTGKKKGTIFGEIDNYNKKNESQKKIIDKIEANTKTEAARLEKEFKVVYEATIELENIMSMIDSFNKANR
ncbi:MAG: flagellar filament capping protein FliD [Candidatus Paracaedibacteraceae bacterium]|nr:flagellar filament capping protein FliD [Candidatus Paracaedibacteraceae bacterium]